MAKPKIWHREDIKAAIRKRYGSLTALAQSWGYNRAAITHALLAPHHRKPSARLIAEALDMYPHQLWPAVFEAEPYGRPNLVGTNRNRPAASPDSQKTRAA